MIRPALAAALLATAPGVTLAQAPRERAQDRHELRQDRRELREDRRDVAWMEQLVARFDDARARRSRAALGAVEGDVVRVLDRELHEARVEVAKSAGETRRSGREVGSADSRPELRDDRRDLRDDRRDLRDDRRDLARVSAIRSDFHALRGRMDRRALDRKRALLAELTRMARAELREDRREVREDRRELREDRRGLR